MLTKQSPNAVFIVWIAVIELCGFQLGKLIYQGFVNNKVLIPVLARRLVLMLANALFKELRHPEMRVAKQCRYAYNGCQHLRIERATTIANQ